jgi:hypothetical protein
VLTATFRLLFEAGYMKGEERINRDRLGDDIVDLLLQQPVDTADETEIARKAKTVAELRHALFNGTAYNEDVEKELDLLIGQLTAGDGKVQDKLDIAGDGKFVLCSKRVTRQVLGENGSPTMTLTRAGKFISFDPDVINRFYYSEAMNRLIGSTKKVRLRMDKAEKRQPLMAAYRPALTQGAHDVVQLELPVGGDATE